MLAALDSNPGVFSADNLHAHPFLIAISVMMEFRRKTADRTHPHDFDSLLGGLHASGEALEKLRVLCTALFHDRADSGKVLLNSSEFTINPRERRRGSRADGRQVCMEAVAYARPLVTCRNQERKNNDGR